jgi:hypothetical protein
VKSDKYDRLDGGTASFTFQDVINWWVVMEEEFHLKVRLEAQVVPLHKGGWGVCWRALAFKPSLGPEKGYEFTTAMTWPTMSHKSLGGFLAALLIDLEDQMAAGEALARL